MFYTSTYIYIHTKKKRSHAETPQEPEDARAPGMFQKGDSQALARVHLPMFAKLPEVQCPNLPVAENWSCKGRGSWICSMSVYLWNVYLIYLYIVGGSQEFKEVHIAALCKPSDTDNM